MEDMLSLLRQNPEDERIMNLALGYFNGDHNKAFEVVEDAILIRGKDKDLEIFHNMQGIFFLELANKEENSDVKFTFLLASVECFAMSIGVQSFSSLQLLKVAKQIGSVLYYRKALKDAKESLSLMSFFDGPLTSIEQDTKSALESVVQEAESTILFGLTEIKSEPKLIESKKTGDMVRSDTHTIEGQRLRSYWATMDVESKRNFMKVSMAKLTAYVERMYGREGFDALEQVLDCARTNSKWRFWMCRSCSQKFFNLKKFKNHLEQLHASKFKSSTTKHITQRVDDIWAGMISVAGWEPVDAVASAEMIKNWLESVKQFIYVNGWSKDWPLAEDEERRKLLQEIRLLLVSFCDYKIFSCSTRDWMMQFPVKHLAQFEISEHTLTTECRIVETPQSICFLECPELSQILDLLKRIKCERADGTELVSNATDNLCSRLRVKEKIDFDHEFSFMLLDKRLLRGKITSFDDEGFINICDRSVHYAKTHPHGDDFITWLLDYPLIEESYEFPRSIRTYNLDMWVAVLKAIHFTCRTLGIKYAKKLQILGYDAALTDVKNICILEDERRKIVPEDQWNICASLLCDQCEERVETEAGDFFITNLFLCAVKDVLKRASHPTFDFPDLEDCLTLINEHKKISDDIVLKSIDILKSAVTSKLPLADSKILLVENSRIKLLNYLTRLSAFDYRSYILLLIKGFLREELEGIVDINAQAKLVAELLFEEKKEKKKKSGPKKKKHRSNKRTSASMSSLLDQNAEHKSSVKLEQEVTSVKLKTAEESAKDPEDSFSTEKVPFEILSNTEGQEAYIKDMPEEDFLSVHIESAHGAAATRYNSALDMTLKALLNIKVLQEHLVKNREPFHGNPEEQVPYALQDFISAFVSEQIKEEGLYTYLLSNILVSLEEFHSLSSYAAEVVVEVLEFCHCWKNPERESLVTRLFTLEEYETMSCRKCRSKPNYPEQSSYGILMAADSIRDLKCAFGNIKFENILKVIRKEDGMLCNFNTGGCGKKNVVHHMISRLPPVFTIVLEWEKNESENEFFETTMALEWEIDISKLYEGLEPNTKYRLVSMIGCGEEGEYICMAYKNNRWVSLKHEVLAEEGVGSWNNVVRLFEERKIRTEVLFYEAVNWPNK